MGISYYILIFSSEVTMYTYRLQLFLTLMNYQ